MRLFHLAPALAIALLVGACAHDGARRSLIDRYPAGATPEATYESFARALRDGQHGAMYDLLSSQARDSFARFQAREEPDPDLLQAMGLDLARFRALPPRSAFVRLFDAHATVRPADFALLQNSHLVGAPLGLGDQCLLRRRLGDGHEDAVLLRREQGKWWIHEEY